jgi:hypothetical protein
MFRNTWPWENFQSLAIPVNLPQGTSTITISGVEGYDPNIDRVEVAPVQG